MEKMRTYRISEIPDPLCTHYRAAAGGDVLAAAGDDCKHVLRTLANMPPGSASVAIRFVFEPTNGGMQSRLGIYMLARSEGKDWGDSLRLLFERGPLTRFYKLQPIERLEAPWAKLNAGCEILRREDAVEPLHPSEFNDRILSYYYTIRPFEPNISNDYVNLDRVLAGIGEPVMIDVCVEPADISPELSEHTRYLSRLQSINRTWDRDQDDEPGMQDYLGGDPDWHSARKQGLGPLRRPDPLSDEILRSQQRLHESLRQPHLRFHIRVLAQTPPVALLVGSVVAESAFEGGSYRLLSCSRGTRLFDEAVQCVKKNRVSALPIHEFLFKDKDTTLYSDLAPLGHLATVDELSGAFRLPVAFISSPQCIRKNTDPPRDDGRDLIVVGYDQENAGLVRGFRLSAAVKSCFVSGTPGSSKTTNMLNWVLQLHQRGVPFLIVEPVKSEYRILKTLRNSSDPNARRLAQDLEVYTPGNEEGSRFRSSPLAPLAGISDDEHIDNLMTCFQAAMPLPGPLPALLREALERVYEDHSQKDRPPMMSDLADAAERVLEEKGYSADTNSDLRGALDVRLGDLTRGSIGKVLQCRHSIPSIEHLMKVPAVIELDRLALDQANLLSLFLFVGIREYLKTVPQLVKDPPRYVIIIEEAHNLVGRSGEARASPDISDPRAFTAEYFCRMLVELRGHGVGCMVVDQFPLKVAAEVIKSTTTKLALRQVDKEDREVLGASMLLTPTEIEELARLNVGEAFLYTEGYHRPRRVKTVNLHAQFDLSSDVLNEKILPYIKSDPWFQQAAAERSVSELTELRARMDLFEDRRLRLNRDLASLIAQQPRVLAQPPSHERAKALMDLRNSAYLLKKRLSDAYMSFLRRSYRRYLPPEAGFEEQDSLVQEMRKNLVSRFELIVKPDVKKCLDIIDEFIARCHSANK